VNVLLSRTDRIGDLVLSTPAIATIRASFPQARVAIVTSEYNAVVVERNHDVDEVIVVPAGANARAFGATLRGYDLAVALAPRFVDLQIVGATRAPLRVGYTYQRRWLARLGARYFLNRIMISEADPDLCDRQPDRVVRHEVDQLLDLVALAGATQRVTKLRIDLVDTDRVVAETLPPGPIVLHVASRWFRSGSTLESTLTLAGELAALGPVVVTCANESEAQAPAFESEAVTRCLRGLPFHQWAAVFERARVVVTVDTGATHVASAMGRPTLVAFEHRYFNLNSQEWSPYGVPHVLVRKPQKAEPALLERFRAEVVAGVAQLMSA
jgi:ADP-heptose:LPS heptosyltransferase